MTAYVADGSQFRVNGQRAGTQYLTSMAALADGGFIAVWISTQGSAYSAKAQRFDAAGDPVGAEFLVTDAAAVGLTNNAEVVGLDNGGFVVVWETADTTKDGSGSALLAQVYDAAGVAQGAVFAVNNEAAGNQSVSAITSLSNGNFVVSWTTAQPAPGGTLSEVHARVFDSAGTALGAEFLLNTTTTGAQGSSRLTATADGGFVAVWTSAGDVFAQVFDAAGATIGTEFLLNTTTAGTQSSPQLTTLSDGRIVAVWETYPATGFMRTVTGQILAADGTKIGGEFLVSDPAGNPQIGEADVDALVDGGFVVTWTAGGGTDVSTAVWAQRYDASGAADGGRYIVNTSTTLFENGGQTVVTAAGDIVTAWSSWLAVQNYDVSARIFARNEAPNIVSDGGAATAAFIVAEHQTAVSQVVATDRVSPVPVSFSIAGGADAALFEIDAATGHLRFVAAPDAQAPADADLDGVYEVIVAASDGDLSDTQALSVTVAATGRGLLIASPAQFAADEGSATVGTISATDAAAAFAITGGADAALFAVDAATGVLSFVAPANFEAPADADANNLYEVEVTASDGSQSVAQSVAVAVGNVNEAPVFVTGAAITALENATFVTTLAAADPDGDPLSYYSLYGADRNAFSINVVTGALTFTSAPNFEAPGDADHNGVYELEIRITDGDLMASRAFAITLANVNEGTTISSNGGGATAAFSVAENQTSATTVIARDAAGPQVTYSISGGYDAARFTINAQTGVLSFVTAPDYEAPNDQWSDRLYNVTVAATDGLVTDTQALEITLTNVVETPVITSNGGGSTAAISINENVYNVTAVTALNRESASSFTYSIIGGADAARFSFSWLGELNFASGGANYEAPTDANGDNVYDVVISVSNGIFSDTQTLAVTVLNVNDPPVFSSPTAFSVQENTTAVGTISATDLEGQPVTYAIGGGVDAARFAINSTTGALSFVTAPNFEVKADSGANNVYNVTIVASDGAVSSSSALAVTVTNVNETPVITSNGGGATAAVSIAENSFATITTVTSTDPENTTRTYSIVGGADAARFSISSTGGQLSFSSFTNFEAPTDANANNVYEVTVRASDGTLSDTQDISVTVTNVNEAPTITSGSAFTVAENGLAVTTVIATDPDGTVPSYSISGGVDAARFTINTVSGALSFVASPNFEAPADVGANNVYDVIVRASDGSLSTTRALTITVSNVNETPVITSNGGGATAAVTIDENGTTVATVASTDPENTARTYSIAGGADAALFAIDAASGALSFIAAPDRETPGDADGNNVYEVTVSATDGANSDTQALSVTVANVNEAPVITSSAAISVSENDTAVATVAAADPEGGVTYALAGGADAELFAIDAATGALSFVSAPDHEAPADADGDNVYEVVVSASDGSLSDTQALSVTITNVNEAPVITSSAAVSLSENDTAVATVAAADPEGGVTYALAGGADAALFAIDAATGALAFITAPDHEAPADADGDNVYEVVVSASDGSLSDTQTLSVTVANINEAPVITSSASVSLSENGTAVTTVAAADPEGGVTYALAGGADAALFAIDAATGALSFVAAPDFEAPADADGDNLYEVVVSASDGSLSDTRAQTVAVGNVNEAITITSGSAFTVVENGLGVTIVTATDVDGTAPSYAIVGGADAALFAIDAGTGALTFVAAPDHEAPADADGDNVYEVVVSASDGSLSDTQALSVTVGNVNEAPVVTSSASIALDENDTAVTTVTAADPEGSVTYALAGGADAALFAIDAATGALAFITAPDHEAPGDADADNVYEVTVSATDGANSDTQALSVTVANVNEAPVITSSAAISVSENDTAVATVAAADPEGGVTYALAGGADAAQFAIDAATGALAFITAPDHEAPADADGDNVYEVVVSASDGSLSDSQALSVTITNVNEAPVITSSATVLLSENDTAVATVAAADPEGGVTYALAGGGDVALFAIDAATGALAFITAPDHEAPADADGDNVYEVVVSASDGSLSDTQALSVTVANVNEAPVITSSASVSLSENGTAVTTVAAADPEGGLTYALAGGADAARFAIDAGTGALRFLAAPDFETPADADADNVYEVVVSASDGSLVDTQALAVSIGNLNDNAPVLTPFLSDTIVSAMAENNASYIDFGSTDADGDTVAFSLAGQDAASFTVDAASGLVQFVAAPDFEAPGSALGSNSYVFDLVASDGAFSDVLHVTLHVFNANEPLSITSDGGGAQAAVTVAEHATAVTTVAASDLDFTAPAYAIAGGADAALFAIDAVTGALSFVAPADFEAPGDADGDNVYQITVAASDGTFADTQALSVTVTDANDAPAIVSDGGGGSATLALGEGATAVTTVAATDPDGGSPLAYALAGGADEALFAIDAASGALSFLATPDFEAPADADGDNVYQVVVSVSDGSLGDTQALSVTVGNANEAPVFGSNGGGASAALAVSENATAVTTVAASDPEGNVTYALAGGADAARFSIEAGTGALSFIAVPNFEAPADADGNNVYEVVVSASDGSLADTQALSVTVGNADETPVITSNGGGASAALAVSENATAVTTVAASDPDGGVTYMLAGGADVARFAIDASTGALRFVAAPNFEAPADADGNNVYEVVVSASDGSLGDTQALTVTVSNVNEAPVISSGGGGSAATYSVTENTSAVATIAAADPESGVTYALAGGADAARFTINAGTGVLGFVAAPDFDAPADANGDNLYQVVVSATDGSLSDTQALTVSVGNVVGLTLNGTSAANTLTGGSEEDTIQGLAGADTLSGLGGPDTLDGGDGQDRLTGGAGADRLTGGLKADDFVFTALGDSTLTASDRILDFSHSQGDDIDLSALDANASLAGNQAFSFIGGAAFSGSAGQLRAFQQGSDTFVQGDVNGDGAADFQIIVDPLVTLVAGDFIL